MQTKGRIGRWRAVQTAMFVVGLAMFLLWVIGQWARDGLWLTAICFYIPSVFLAAVLFGLGVVLVWCQRLRLGGLTVLLALPPFCIVLLVENDFRTVTPNAVKSDFRLVHWNVGGTLEPQGAQQVLIAQQADLYVLSEIPDRATVLSFQETLGSDFQAEVFGNLAVVGRGKVQANGWLTERGRARVQTVAWQCDGRSLALFVVDLPSAVWIPRDPLLREVVRLVEQHQPDLVVGDFNAPRRSQALTELPDGYRHAYHSAGSGLGYTWPAPMTMYALDHCLHSSRIVPARYVLGSSFHSDHCYQVFDFVVLDRR